MEKQGFLSFFREIDVPGRLLFYKFIFTFIYIKYTNISNAENLCLDLNLEIWLLRIRDDTC